MSLFPLTSKKTNTSPDLVSWLQLIRTENVGPITFYKLIEQYGSAKEALAILPELAKSSGRKKPLIAPSAKDIEKEIKALEKLGGQFITADDERYPIGLSALDDAPPVLATIGDLSLLDRMSLGIVGARNASLNGRKIAAKLANDLGTQDYIIVSGMARGIDTAAHEAALNTGTIAVVAGGIDMIYPQENTDLYNAIRKNGLIIAESPMGVAPKAQHFPRRNRIVSGLSKGIIVIEATLKSGSLITARYAGEQGRDVYAVTGHPADPRSAGPNSLIRDGAILVRNADDVLESLQNFTGHSLQDNTPSPTHFIAPTADILTDAMRETVLNNLSFHATAVDELLRSCELSIGSLHTILLELELAGRLKRLPGNAVSLIE